MNGISDYISLKINKTNKKVIGVFMSVAEKTADPEWH